MSYKVSHSSHRCNFGVTKNFEILTLALPMCKSGTKGHKQRARYIKERFL
jgi:hypothetical protein